MEKLKEWETKWSAQDYRPPWMIGQAPEELRRSVRSGGFPPGSRLLDMGCGNGAISAWLARKGFSVLGIDFAQAAIDKANRGFGNVPKLAFKAVDVCDENVDLGLFDGLFDRGCLHTLPPATTGKYAANVARWSRKDALFLLIHKTPAKSGESMASRQLGVRKELGGLFKPWFRLLDVKPTFIVGDASARRDWKMPALAIWMARR